ncbi:hypothetical protein ACEPAI_1208 [Sanghuangporus weigelae]
MSEPTLYALRVIRVKDIPRKEENSALDVEVKFDNSTRKTGTLNANAEPAWRSTLTFACSDKDAGVFDVRLRKSTKRIGSVKINLAELLRESAEGDVRRDLFIPKNIPPFSRNRLGHARIDNVAQIHPVVKVSWQIATALYKAVSEQLRIDLQLNGDAETHN